MIGKFIGAAVGRGVAKRYGGTGIKGALLGAAAPWLVRRAFTPLGFLAIGAFGAKKYLDSRRERERSGRATDADRWTEPSRR